MIKDPYYQQCDHRFVHIETQKRVAERPSFGFSAAKPWVRKDIYFCEKCLTNKIVVQEASYSEYPYGPPEWW